MSRINDFFRGVGYLIGGFKFLISNPRIWVWAIIPTIINLTLMAVMISVFIHYYGDLYGWLAAHIGHIDTSGWTAWYWYIVKAFIWIASIFFQMLIVLVSLIIILIAVWFSSGLSIGSLRCG